MMRKLIILMLLACSSAFVASAQTNKPDWYAAHVDFMTRDGGRWVAENPASATDPAQPDAFGMEWRAANDGHLLIGRLFGLKDGAEIAEYWTFREFWHPGERRAILEQWGGPGVYGVGEATSPAANRGALEQTFWLPDGRAWREGHRTVENGDEYVTDQFNISEAGEWTPNGSYVWRRVRAD